MDTKLYNSYYQWVPVFFIVQASLVISSETDTDMSLQAILFYIPRCIWLSTEGGMMAFLVAGCTDRVVDNTADKQAALLRNYCEHIHNKFNKYAFCFFFCELLNICISISQVG